MADSAAIVPATAPSGLLEREREFSAITTQVDLAPIGDGSVLLIEGPAGIGKTELLRSALSHAQQQGFSTARARAGRLERNLPHGVVRQLLEPLLSVRVAGQDLFAGAAGLAAPVFDTLGAAEAPPGEQRYSLLHGLYWLTSNLADAGLTLLCVDDAHLADGPSLRYLAYLARRIEGLPVVLVMALRTGEECVEEEALADIRGNPAVRVLQPGPLSEHGVGSLVEAQLHASSPPAFTAAIHRATGGNPFLVRELVLALAADRVVPGDEAAPHLADLRPRTVTRAVAARLARLPTPAVALTQAVAILGDGAGLNIAADLAGIRPDEAAAAADVLVAAQVLQTSEMSPGLGLSFVHPLIRATVEEGISTDTGAAAHARAARLLLARGAEPARVAAHLLHTEPEGDTALVALLRRAAGGALRTGAPAIAVAYLRRAIAEVRAPPDSSLLCSLGTAELRTSMIEAPATFALALETAKTSDDLAAAAVEFGRALAMAGRWEEGMAVLARAIERLGDRPELVAMLEVDRLLIGHAGASQRPLLLRYLEGADQCQPGAATRVALGLASVEEVMVGDSPGTAIDHATQALGQGEMLAVIGPEANAFWAAASGLAISGACRQARVEAGLAMARTRELGSAAGFVVASSFRAWYAWCAGDLGEAEADVRAALVVPVSEQLWWFVKPTAIAALVGVLLEQGKVHEADVVFTEHPFSTRARQIMLYDLVLMARGQLRLAQGRPAEALEDFEHAGRRTRAWGTTTSGIVSSDAYAAYALLALGDRQRAAVAAAAELVRARRFPAPRQLGIALRAWAHASEGDQAIDGFRQAVAVLAPSEIRLEHAAALIDLGSALCRAGEVTEARLHLRAGLDLATSCKAPMLAERARNEIEASGARVGRETLTGAAALTSSERQVAQLAAEGRTNREIAQALFVTASTVELHLSHAYRKLGIISRYQLGGALTAIRPHP